MTRFTTAYMACGESTARLSLSARSRPGPARAPPGPPGRTHGGSQHDAEVEAQRLPVLLEDLLLALGARLPLGLRSQERRSASARSPGPRNPGPALTAMAAPAPRSASRGRDATEAAGQGQAPGLEGPNPGRAGQGTGPGAGWSP